MTRPWRNEINGTAHSPIGPFRSVSSYHSRSTLHSASVRVRINRRNVVVREAGATSSAGAGFSFQARERGESSDHGARRSICQAPFGATRITKAIVEPIRPPLPESIWVRLQPVAAPAAAVESRRPRNARPSAPDGASRICRLSITALSSNPGPEPATRRPRMKISGGIFTHDVLSTEPVIRTGVRV